MKKILISVIALAILAGFSSLIYAQATKMRPVPKASQLSSEELKEGEVKQAVPANQPMRMPMGMPMRVPNLKGEVVSVDAEKGEIVLKVAVPALKNVKAGDIMILMVPPKMGSVKQIAPIESEQKEKPKNPEQDK